MPKLYAGLTVIEILGLAIKKEADAARFYRHVADHIPNPIIKSRFLALAKDERQHKGLLLAEYKRLTGGDHAPTPPKDFPKDKNYDFGKFSIEQALKFAIAAERDAQKMYAAAAKGSTDPRGKQFLDYLVEFEKGHERQLRQELDFYKKAPLWFEEVDDLIHMGP
ncbi:MAG: ferritin family protein [Candidatus Lernaella stagnicola]|nr:ferritin family protein [Candidatus Lernaella stagnicola]